MMTRRHVRIVDGITPAAAAAIALGMRAADRMELDATNWATNPQQYAQRALKAHGTRFTVYLGDRPVAILGAMQTTPGVAALWGWGTDESLLARVAVTRRLRQMVDAMLTRDSGVHRVQAISHEERFDAHRWLQAAGLRRESTLREYGKAGEDFIVFATTRTTYQGQRKVRGHHVEHGAG